MISSVRYHLGATRYDSPPQASTVSEILGLTIYVSPLQDQQGRETYCFSPGVRLFVCHKLGPLYNLKTA